MKLFTVNKSSNKIKIEDKLDYLYENEPKKYPVFSWVYEWL